MCISPYVNKTSIEKKWERNNSVAIIECAKNIM